MSTTIQDLQNQPPKKRHSIVDLEKMPPKKMVATFLQENKAMIQSAIPKHVNGDRVLQVAQVAITQSPKLLECSAESLFGALIKSTQYGLELNNALGEAFLIPRSNNKKDAKGKWSKVMEASLQLGYPGQLKLIRNSKEISNITPRAVHEGDFFEYEYGLDERLVHRPIMTGAGEMTYVYLVAEYKDGAKQFWVWSREDMIRHRDKFVHESMRRSGSPWADNFESMCLKTTINLAAKWLPKSIESAEAIHLDQAADAGVSQGLDRVIDGSFDEVLNTPVEQMIEEQEKEYFDKNGEVFDPEMHASNEGGPIYNQDGTFRAKRGTKTEPKPKPVAEQPEPEQQPAVEPQQDEYIGQRKDGFEGVE